MNDPLPPAIIRAARRYMVALRVFSVGLILFPTPVIAALALPVNAIVFLALVVCFLACAAAVFGSGMYLSDFACPQCRQVCTCRRAGNSFPLSRCLNCGLSLRAAAASDL